MSKTFICLLPVLVYCARLAGQVVIVGAGESMPSAIRLGAGAITTLYVTGLNTRIMGRQSATSVPLPNSLDGVSVEVIAGTQTYQAPLFAIQQATICTDQTQTSDCVVTAITIQVPFEVASLAGTTAGINVSENGSISKNFNATLLADDVHVLTSCDVSVGENSTAGQCPPLVYHEDSTQVSASSPLHAGETAVIYATGLGQTNPPVETGVASPNPPATVGGVLPGFTAQLNFYPNAGPSKPYTLGQGSGPGSPGSLAAFVGLVPGYVGLYQINVPIAGPALGTPPCLGGVMSNLTINVGSRTSFDGAPICVAVP